MKVVTAFDLGFLSGVKQASREEFERHAEPQSDRAAARKSLENIRKRKGTTNLDEYAFRVLNSDDSESYRGKYRPNPPKPLRK